MQLRCSKKGGRSNGHEGDGHRANGGSDRPRSDKPHKNGNGQGQAQFVL